MDLKHKIKSVLFALKCYKLTSLSNRCYIINYHKIVNTPHRFYPEISTEIFEKQIRHLAENYTIIPIDELVDRIGGKRTLRKYVAITFDDGFRDNYTNAYPVLKKYNAPASIFLVSGCVETGEAPWFIKFRHAFATNKNKDIKIALGNTKLDLRLDTLENKLNSSNQVMSLLRDCPDKERIEYLSALYDALEYPQSKQPSNMMLKWTQIKEMANHGISFGAHTHSHPILSRLSRKDAEQEIKLSKEIIEAKIGFRINGFAYPVGSKTHYKEELFAVLKENEFKYAVTTSTNAISYTSNPYELSRPFPWELNVL